MMQDLMFMITIVNDSKGEKVLSLYEKQQVPLVFSSVARGTAGDQMLEYLGLGETERLAIFSVMSQGQAKVLKRELMKRMDFDIPGNGILFTVPVSSVGGSHCANYLAGNPFPQKGEIAMKHEYELIVVVTNRGYVDQVMHAARSENASGGTVIHARGKGVEQAERFFGVSIADEKEVVLIVTKSAHKNAMMKAIITQAGMHTKARSVLFTLPVNDIVGIRSGLEDMEENRK